MAAAGISSAFPIDELSIFGLIAIPQRLPTILRRIREAARAVVAARPDALIIVDSPDFTHRVARIVRRLAPEFRSSITSRRRFGPGGPGERAAMRAYVDRVLAILPFEPATHADLGGPPCTYVGHPLVERIAELRPNADEAQRRNADPPIVLVLPGSRSSEVRRLLGIFGAAIARVACPEWPDRRGAADGAASRADGSRGHFKLGRGAAHRCRAGREMGCFS